MNSLPASPVCFGCFGRVNANESSTQLKTGCRTSAQGGFPLLHKYLATMQTMQHVHFAPQTTHGCSFDLSSNAHWIHHRSRSQSVSPVNVWWGTVFWICGSAWNRVCASGLSLALKKGALEVHPSQKRHEKTRNIKNYQGIESLLQMP